MDNKIIWIGLMIIMAMITIIQEKKEAGEKIDFRTTDLTYGTDTAVAFTSICGNILVAQGRTNGACTNHYCDDTDQLLNVPSASGTTKLWVGSGVDANELCICEDGMASGYSRRYSPSDSDASKVSTSSAVIDPAKEHICSGTCTPIWSCASWSTCSSGCSQTRTCADSNNCGVSEGKPIESQSCAGGSCPSCPSTICSDNTIDYTEVISVLNKWIGG